MRNAIFRFAVLLVLSLAALPFVVGQDKSETLVARITVTSEAETLRVVRLGLDLMEFRDGGDLVFHTTREQFEELQKQGWNVRVDERMTQELRSSDERQTFLGGYKTVEETRAFVDQMAAQYPNLATVFTYGQSWEKTRNQANGYNLFGIRLTNNQITGDKPRFFLEAGIHARELVPPEMATRFIQYLLTNYGRDADATWLLDEHEIIVIPIVNPDGRKLAEASQSKRKNTNNLTGGCTAVSSGIDLNRNFSFLWGTVNLPSEPPCGETFPGLSANSEPETLAVQQLLDSLFPHQRPPDRTTPAPLTATGTFLDMHSYGNLVLYPWGQDSTPPPNLQLRTISRRMAAYNGYDPIQSIDLYATSGTAREYAYGQLGVAAIAMESGLSSGACGGFMPPYTCLDGGTGGNFWNLNRPVLLYLAKIARTPYVTGEGPVTDSLTLARNAVATYQVRASVSDIQNGNQNIAAAEVYVDTPPWRRGTPISLFAEDGSFNSPTEIVTGNIPYLRRKHILYVRGLDTSGNWGPITAIFTPNFSQPPPIDVRPAK